MIRIQQRHSFEQTSRPRLLNRLNGGVSSVSLQKESKQRKLRGQLKRDEWVVETTKEQTSKSNTRVQLLMSQILKKKLQNQALRKKLKAFRQNTLTLIGQVQQLHSEISQEKRDHVSFKKKVKEIATATFL